MPVYKKIHPDFLLRGAVLCQCGKLMTANWSTGKMGNRYGCYRCSYCSGVNLSKDLVESSFMDYMTKVSLDAGLANLVQSAVRLNWAEYRKASAIKVKEIEKRKADIIETHNNIMDKSIKRILPDDLVKRSLSELEIELSETSGEISICNRGIVELEKDLLDYSLKVLQDLTTTWSDTDIMHMTTFQKLLFPEGIVYQEGSFRTPKKARILELNDMLLAKNDTMVTLRGIEPRLAE